MKKNRDDFTASIKGTLAKRAGNRCSNPGCGRITCGPAGKEDGIANVGNAAHITAASSGGPRYDPNLTPVERSSISNGIHLCSFCADLIDAKSGIDFSVEMLREWKSEHEKNITEELRNPFKKEQKNRQIRSDVNPVLASRALRALIDLFSDTKAKYFIFEVTKPNRCPTQKHCPDLKKYLDRCFVDAGSYLDASYSWPIGNLSSKVNEILDHLILNRKEAEFNQAWLSIGRTLNSIGLGN